VAKKAVGNLAIVVSANTEAAIKGFQKVGAAGKTMAGKLGKVAFGGSFGGGGGKGWEGRRRWRWRYAGQGNRRRGPRRAWPVKRSRLSRLSIALAPLYLK
jgi:hypothetical protein